MRERAAKGVIAQKSSRRDRTSTIVSNKAFTQLSQSDLDSPVEDATAAIRSGFRLVMTGSAFGFGSAGSFALGVFFFAVASKVDGSLRAPRGPCATNAVAWERRTRHRKLNSFMMDLWSTRNKRYLLFWWRYLMPCSML